MNPQAGAVATTPEDLQPLFEPIRLGTVEVRNRIVMTGHGTGLAENYLPSERHVAYYRERARGGAGLIGMAFPQIHPTSQDVPGEPRAYDPAVVPGLARIADAVHEHGARVVMQLGHGGREGASTFTERALWAPSSIPCPFNLEMPKAMEKGDVEEIVAGHALGARHAKQAGMDGVEIHSGYGGYLLASFLSPFSNFREDEYGGSLENRVRIVLETIAAVRAEVGPDYLVGINLQGHDFSPRGIEPKDAQAIAREIEAFGGVDYICVKAATYVEANQNVPDMQHEKMLWIPLAAAVKEAVSIPVIAVGRILDPAAAAAVVAEGKADMVAMTRQQIADPETAEKMRTGRVEEIRPCIGCNQGCIDRLFKITNATCVHNPAAGYELELGVSTRVPAAEPRRVVVVGGGPAGMKAAEVAALLGHRTTLLERRDALGGQLRLAASVRGREEVAGVYTHLEGQLERLGVDVRLGAEAGAAEVMALDPERVIVATGSAPGRELIGNISQGVLETPGLDREEVLDVWDVLEHGAEVGPRVLIVDDGEGSWKAISLALALDGEGHDIVLSTPLAYVGAKIGPFSQNRLLPRLFASGIEMHPFASLRAVDEAGARLEERGAEVRVDGLDTVILAGWNQPLDRLYLELKAAGTAVERVGDAIACRTMLEAVHEGERAARRL
jgi:2,4-dienoyl-CoA reductase-like NADH-dependent reductase (Old Yellow Enzyme family)